MEEEDEWTGAELGYVELGTVGGDAPVRPCPGNVDGGSGWGSSGVHVRGVGRNAWAARWALVLVRCGPLTSAKRLLAIMPSAPTMAR